MITIEQCRGARGILGWTQQDLADASGLSKTAINNFEKKHSDIKTESLRAIRMAFESAHIEFIGTDGVSKKTETFKILRGPTALNELIDDIHETLNGREDEILISGVDQTLASRTTTQKLFKHIDFLKSNNINERILCFTGSKQILSPNDECRWIDNDRTSMTTFIYGNKVALELWDRSMIIITNNSEANKAERNRFNLVWKDAKTPDQNESDNSQNETITLR